MENLCRCWPYPADVRRRVGGHHSAALVQLLRSPTTEYAGICGFYAIKNNFHPE